MQITRNIYLVGSGEPDLMPTDKHDSQVYLVQANSTLILIDAGAGLSVDRILANVLFHNFDPQAIRWLLLTHTHADHAGGAAELKAIIHGLRVAVSADSADWLRDGNEQLISLNKAQEFGLYYPPDYRFQACDVDIELHDSQQLSLEDLRVNVISSPGHCRGHMSFMIETEGKRALFSGDAIFPNGKILLQDIWDCNLHESLRSVERLADLHVNHLFAGHGHPVVDHAPEHFKLAIDRINNLVIPYNLI